MQIGRMMKKMSMLLILYCMIGIICQGLLQLQTVAWLETAQFRQGMITSHVPLVINIKFHTTLVVFIVTV